MGQWKEMWGSAGGSAVPGGVSRSKLSSPASCHKYGAGWENPRWGQACCPGPEQQMVGELETGEQGRTGAAFQPT